MLIFVYGDDTFRVKEKVSEMKARFAEKFDPTGMNLAVFSDKPHIGEVMQAVQSPPFLGDKRMTIVRDLAVGLKKAAAEDWVAGFKKTPESSNVIFWETSEPKKVEVSELFKSFKKSADVHLYPFPLLQGIALQKWVADRAKAMGASFEKGALEELTARVSSDLWRMQLELKKLHAFTSGSPILIETVRNMVHASFEDRIFDFVDAVSRKDTKAALKLLEEERLSGASDHHLLSMLTRQVRILLGARALLEENPRATKDDLANALKIHPYVAQKSLQQARAFSLDHLKAAHDALFHYDLDLKTGKIQPEMAVDLTVSSLLQV